MVLSYSWKPPAPKSSAPHQRLGTKPPRRSESAIRNSPTTSEIKRWVSSRSRQVDAAIVAVGASDYADAPVGLLSGGPGAVRLAGRCGSGARRLPTVPGRAAVRFHRARAGTLVTSWPPVEWEAPSRRLNGIPRRV